MKIVHIEDRFHPEMGYQINFFSKYHNPADEFIILSSNSFSLWDGTDASKLLLMKDSEYEKKYNVKIVRLFARLDRKGKYNIWLIGLVQAILELNPDIVYVHAIETFTAIRVILSGKIRRKFMIVSDTHVLLNQFKPDIKFKFIFWLYRQIIISLVNRNNIKVFYTTEENRRILLEKYKIRPDLIKSALIGTDSSVYYFDIISRESERLKLDIETDAFVLLYTGKFNQSKQPHLIFEAVKLIEKKIDKKLWLVFVGSADQKYTEQNFMFKFENKLIKSIILPSVNNAELYKYYSMADLAVFPKENTLSSLDVQACKLPAIMEEDDTNKERLRDGGMVYKRNELSDLADKILYLFNNSDQRKSLSEFGQQFVLENYDYKSIIQKMEAELTSGFHKQVY
jgi:glycosyltransferase involved in cell wall biosynthesis